MRFRRDIERDTRISCIKLSSEMVNDLINIANKVINTGLMVNRLDDFFECSGNLNVADNRFCSVTSQ
jgi:hypothetical protein